MNLEIGKKLRWIKGDNFDMVEIIKHPDDLEYVYFESGRRINPELIPEFMIEDFGDLIFDNMNSNEFENTQLNTQNFQIESTQKENSEFLLLFKGRNLIEKNFKVDFNFKVPTEFIIKGLLSAYGLNEIEPSLVLMVKKQILDNIEEISKKIVGKITNKIKNGNTINN